MLENSIYFPKIYHGDCAEILKKDIPEDIGIQVSFLDPPFNQDKNYDGHNDSMEPEEYWNWMKEVCSLIHSRTQDGGYLFFMQREKNTEQVLRVLRETGWTYRNLIIWKKKTSAVPMPHGFGLQYQIIACGIKGKNPKNFNKLRIDLALTPDQKVEREDGVYVTDVWDDIRELTSGFFAGDEAIKDEITNKRAHEQQAPIALLLRIILSTTQFDDLVFDPFSGTGTTSITAMQLNRRSIGIEKSPKNVELINSRIMNIRDADKIGKYQYYYRFTVNLDKIWNIEQNQLRFPIVTERKIKKKKKKSSEKQSIQNEENKSIESKNEKSLLFEENSLIKFIGK